MDLRNIYGKSLDEIENEEIDNEDAAYGGMEKTNELRIKNDINRKKYFKNER